MELLFKIIGIAFCSAMLSLLLRKSNPEFALAVTIVTSVLIFTMLFHMLKDVFVQIKAIAGLGGVDLSYLAIVVKVVSIAYLSEYACAVLEDAGESAIAKKVELTGKVILFFIALPIIESLFKLIIALF